MNAGVLAVSVQFCPAYWRAVDDYTEVGRWPPFIEAGSASVLCQKQPERRWKSVARHDCWDVSQNLTILTGSTIKNKQLSLNVSFLCEWFDPLRLLSRVLLLFGVLILQNGDKPDNPMLQERWQRRALAKPKSVECHYEQQFSVTSQKPRIDQGWGSQVESN